MKPNPNREEEHQRANLLLLLVPLLYRFVATLVLRGKFHRIEDHWEGSLLHLHAVDGSMVHPDQRCFKRQRPEHSNPHRGAVIDGRPPYRRKHLPLDHDWGHQRRYSGDRRYNNEFTREHQRQRQQPPPRKPHPYEDRRGSFPSPNQKRRSIAWVPPSQVKQTVSSTTLQQQIRRTSSNPNTTAAARTTTTADRNHQGPKPRNPPERRDSTNPIQTDLPKTSYESKLKPKNEDQGIITKGETACCSFQFSTKEGRLVEATDPTVASTATHIALEKVMPPSEVVLRSPETEFSPSPPNPHSSLDTSPVRVEDATPRQPESLPDAAEKQSSNASDCTDVSLLHEGLRVAIYWEGEQKYFEGTIQKHDDKRKKPLFVRYDDGDSEWVSFRNERFRILSNNGDATKDSRGDHGSPVVEDERAGKTQGPRQTHSDESEQTMLVNQKTNVDQGDWVKADDVERSSSDSETDEEELGYWAHKMLGAPLPVMRQVQENVTPNVQDSSVVDYESWGDAVMSISEKVKLARSRNSGASASTVTAKPDLKKKRKKVKSKAKIKHKEEFRKHQSKTLSTEEIRAILAEDSCVEAGCSTSWVRRSMRQPSRSALDSSRVKDLVHKLTSNDPDMVVLKMKKYCPDLDTPQIVIDAVLDALEDNENCEALYIQNFNEGVRDEQVLHLLRILQQPTCKIWCLNIGETYNVKTKTWKKFAKGLKQTKVTHMYASEHTISTELKDYIRATIRDNRSKHTMHIDPQNLGTIVKCTHCWWNPINAKALRPFIRQAGFEKILDDAEALGLRGTSSGSTLS